jgi:nucleotide-binding universal stress UspA family protein
LIKEIPNVKVIVAVDDSPYSQRVIEKVAHQRWPRDTEFKVLTVVESVSLDDLARDRWADLIGKVSTKRKEAALKLCQEAREKLLTQIRDARVHYEIRQGSPRAEIVDAAVEWEADKIIIGAHGRGVCPRFILGSVSSAVVQHAPCTVEIVRPKTSIPTRHEPVKAAATQG